MVDDREFAVVRISGHPVKNLSFWITQADFVREYEKIGGFWLPVKDETLVGVKMYGKKNLTIEHQIDTVNGVKVAALRDGNADTVGVSEESKTDWKKFYAGIRADDRSRGHYELSQKRRKWTTVAPAQMTNVPMLTF
jgi:hypothetical protein